MSIRVAKRSVLAGVVLFVVAFCVFYVGIEHPAYFWDWGGYFNIYKDYGRLIFSGDGSWLAKLGTDVANADYNPTSVLPLMPVYALLGDGRTAYVAATAVVYLIPAVMCAMVLAGALEKSPQKQLLCLALALLYTPFWAPTLRGMPDIAGLVSLGLAAIILLRTDYLAKADVRSAIAFGALVWCTFLFRRWYAFSIIALIVVACVFALFTLRAEQNRLRSLGRITLAYASAGVTALALGLLFQAPLLKRILSTSYGEIYSAYRLGGLWDQLANNYLDSFGALLLALIGAGIVLAVVRRNSNVNFCTIVALATLLAFSSIQSPGPQHLLPIALFLFPAYYLAAEAVADNAPWQLGWIGVPAMAALTFVSTFVPAGWGPAESVRTLLPQARIYPLHLENYGEYRRLTADLEKLAPGSEIAVYASSGTLSDSLLAALEPKLTARLIWNSHVDLRDRFRVQALNAEYVVIGTPTPTHLREEDQQVITLPAELIRSGEGIGEAFSALPSEYRLEGTTAKIYKRTRPFHVDEVSGLLHQFYEAYPAWRDDYRADLSIAMVEAQIVPGDGVGVAKQLSANQLFIHPGNTGPTWVDMPLSENFRPSRVSIRVSQESPSQCATADGVGLKVEGDTGVWFDKSVLPGEEADVTIGQGEGLFLWASPLNNPVCDHVTVTFHF